MELVFGKVFQTTLSAFIVGGGLTMFRAVDDRVFGRYPVQQGSVMGQSTDVPVQKQAALKPPTGYWRTAVIEAVKDGSKTGLTVGVGAAVFGTTSLLRHGRYHEQFFQPREDGLSVFTGLAAASYVYMPSSPGYQRVAVSCVIGVVGALFAESLSSPQSIAPP